jgi:predicted RecB family nuclease
MVELSPQGGYLAKRCPEAVQLDVLKPCEPDQPSPIFERLAANGVAFEAEIFRDLVSLHNDVYVVDKFSPRQQREEMTAVAMAVGREFILGGRLPTDIQNHRVGEPDILMKASVPNPQTGIWQYVAIDVKSHKTQGSASGSDDHWCISDLLKPSINDGSCPMGIRATWRKSDLLQLAHYQRMLEECGHASNSPAVAGIIGIERQIAWYDLDFACWSRSEYISNGDSRRLTTMESYDVEFSFRLSVLSAALEYETDPSVQLLAEPIAVPDCANCQWQTWCFKDLERTEDPSLLPRVGPTGRQRHIERGSSDLTSIASLDPRTARLIAQKVDLKSFVDLTMSSDPQTSVAEIIPRSPKQIRLLNSEGIHTAADTALLDLTTLSYADTQMTNLPEQIDMARARIGKASVYRRRGVTRVLVPRGDVELDIDMENVDEGCYMWGVLISDRRTMIGELTEYRSFVSWETPTENAELDAFARFWDWLTNLRQASELEGWSLRAYCYNAGAENGQMRRIAVRCGLEEPVGEFISSEQWVDLLPLVRRQIITGRGVGLKTVAPLTGFHWRADEVGGDLAMNRYYEATDDAGPELQAEARDWILTYNEDDVRATLALRQWLDGRASSAPSIEDWKGAISHSSERPKSV